MSETYEYAQKTQYGEWKPVVRYEQRMMSRAIYWPDAEAEEDDA